MSYDITHITRDEILNGYGYFCCMSGIRERKLQCDMWSTIYDDVGGIGLLARSGDKLCGQLIYMPKHFARRICMPIGKDLGDMETTMAILCVKVEDHVKNQGIASSLIDAAIRFCKQKGYRRIEAYVDPLPPLMAEDWVPSFSAFKKYGFTVDDSDTAWESKPTSRICHLDL